MSDPKYPTEDHSVRSPFYLGIRRTSQIVAPHSYNGWGTKSKYVA